MGGVGSAFAAVAQPDPASDAALEAPFSVLQNRKHQAFPRLTQAEIARMMRFGTVRQFGRDDYLCRIGDRAVGMVVVLRGRIQVVLRDGMGRETRPPEQGPGNFACEVGQLSGRAAMADILALEPVEVLHINPENLRALITAEAELGERIMRALILRRVNLIEQGSGPVLLGCGKRPGLLALQSFLRRNGYPHTVIDAQNDPEAVEGQAVVGEPALRGEHVVEARPVEGPLGLLGPHPRPEPLGDLLEVVPEGSLHHVGAAVRGTAVGDERERRREHHGRQLSGATTGPGEALHVSDRKRADPARGVLTIDEAPADVGVERLGLHAQAFGGLGGREPGRAHRADHDSQRSDGRSERSTLITVQD